MKGILLLDDDLIRECNDLGSAVLEQVFRLGETVGGFLHSGGESGFDVLFCNITLILKLPIQNTFRLLPNYWWFTA